MRVTQHSGVGKGNVRHNTRESIKKALEKGKQLEDKHIDVNRIDQNILWVLNEEERKYERCKEGQSVADVERAFYEKHYGEALEQTNQKYLANYHPERCKTIDDVLRDRKADGRPNKTAPEEIILQIGDKDEHPEPALFVQCVKDYMQELLNFDYEHGNHMHILDVSIHLDEATPHAHIRRVIDYVDEKGLTHIGQAKGLEQMGIEPPDTSVGRSRHNTPKMTFDAQMRQKWIAICKNHGLEIEEEVKEPGRKHIQDKDKFIAYKQEQQEALLNEKNELLGKFIDDLNQDAEMGIFEGIERGLELPEGALTDAIQKSIDKTSEINSLLPAGTTFKDFMVDELAREVNNLIKPDKEKSRDREFEDEIYDIR